MKAFYFGCSDRPGHYMNSAERSGITSQETAEFLIANPWGFSVDGGLCPKGRQIEGLAVLHHKNGWSALSFWDRSVDSRPDSNSTFLVEGTHTFANMRALAEQHFPRVIARLRFPIVDAAAAKAATS